MEIPCPDLHSKGLLSPPLPNPLLRDNCQFDPDRYCPPGHPSGGHMHASWSLRRYGAKIETFAGDAIIGYFTAADSSTCVYQAVACILKLMDRPPMQLSLPNGTTKKLRHYAALVSGDIMGVSGARSAGTHFVARPQYHPGPPKAGCGSEASALVL